MIKALLLLLLLRRTAKLLLLKALLLRESRLLRKPELLLLRRKPKGRLLLRHGKLLACKRCRLWSKAKLLRHKTVGVNHYILYLYCAKTKILLY